MHSVIGLATKRGRPPKWIRSASGISCGFGRAVVSISNNNDANPQQQRFAKIDTIVEHVKIDTIMEYPELVAVSEIFEAEFDENDFISYYHDMTTRVMDAYESQCGSLCRSCLRQIPGRSC